MTVELRAVCDQCGEGGPVLDAEAHSPGEAVVAAGLICDGDRHIHADHDDMDEADQHAAQAELERFWPEAEFRDPVQVEADREVFARMDLAEAHHDWLSEQAWIDPRDYL